MTFGAVQMKRTDEGRYDLIDCWRSGQIPEERMVELLREDVRLLRLFNQVQPIKVLDGVA